MDLTTGLDSVAVSCMSSQDAAKVHLSRRVRRCAQSDVKDGHGGFMKVLLAAQRAEATVGTMTWASAVAE